MTRRVITFLMALFSRLRVIVNMKRIQIDYIDYIELISIPTQEWPWKKSSDVISLPSKTNSHRFAFQKLVIWYKSLSDLHHSLQQRRLRQMLEIFERHGVAEMLRRSLTDAAPEDIIREITQDRVTSIGEIDDTVLSMIRITEEQARKRQKQKEELRIEFLKSIRWFAVSILKKC